MVSDEMMNLLQALDPTLPSVAAGAPIEQPSNVYLLKFPEKGPTGDTFTPEERTQIRAMLKAFQAIQSVCPVAKNASR
jgi:hypothetical protein